MSHQRGTLSLIAIAIAMGVGACAAPAGSATDGAAQSATAAPSNGESPSESADASVATPDPVPSEDLGEFSCELPIVEDPSVPLANIIDVRVGAHEGYDRVVFEFEQGTPELTLDRALPPFTQDGSGFPIDVEGESFLRLIMRGGSKQTDAGTSSYDGPTDFDPGLPAIVDLIEGGDFERQSTWYFGLTADSCVRVILLADPARLVIDVEH
jgi:hypothetical protein